MNTSALRSSNGDIRRYRAMNSSNATLTINLITKLQKHPFNRAKPRRPLRISLGDIVVV